MDTSIKDTISQIISHRFPDREYTISNYSVGDRTHAGLANFDDAPMVKGKLTFKHINTKYLIIELSTGSIVLALINQ